MGDDSTAHRDRWPIFAAMHEVEDAALAVYGSLVPGEEHHWVVSRLSGDWLAGEVHGYLFEVTWGPAQGYLGFLPEPEGHIVDVWVLSSPDLDKKWREIDDFEGPGYERQSISVRLKYGGEVEAQIYVALTDT